jgi:hypothetical protein
VQVTWCIENVDRSELRNEAIGAGVQRPGAERLDLPVEVLGHLRNLGLGQPRSGEGPGWPEITARSFRRAGRYRGRVLLV